MSETSLAMTRMGALMPRAHGYGKIQRLKYKVGGAVASGCFALGANLASKLGVTGTVNDTRESLRDVQNDIESGLDLSPIITHRLPIADFQQGFNAMESGEAGKVILDWVD